MIKACLCQPTVCPMTILRPAIALFLVCLIAACDPTQAVSPEKKAYHKANREAYLYQGI